MATPRQPVLGILMLDTRFPRPRGDIGNPESFDHDILVRRLPGALVETVVTSRPLSETLARAFIEQARLLEADGATIITTSCGFLSPLQARLQAAVSVPVISSALWLLPMLRARQGPRRPIGILTFDASSLSAHHIPDTGPVVVEGLLPDDHLRQVIAKDLPELDQNRASRDVVAAAGRLLTRAPGVRTIVLECTNFPPYRAAIAQARGVELLDIHDAISHLQNVYKTSIN